MTSNWIELEYVAAIEQQHNSIRVFPAVCIELCYMVRSNQSDILEPNALLNQTKGWLKLQKFNHNNKGILYVLSVADNKAN